MNMGGALEANYEGEWGYKVRRNDIKRLKRAGFDTIRLPARISAHTQWQAPYRIDPSFLARIDEIARWATAENLQIIIDVHHYVEMMEDQNTDFHEERLEAIWNQLAMYFSKWPPNLMFEFLNEPYDSMSIDRVNSINRRLLSRIRKDNPTRWVIIGGGEWGTLGGLTKSNPPKDPRVVTTFHFYEPFDFTHQGAEFVDPPRPFGPVWGAVEDYSELSKTFAEAARWRNRTGMPLLLGEFGVYKSVSLGQRAQWTRAVRQEAEKNGFGWCYWDWSTSFLAFDTDRNRWLGQILTSLTRY
jgi:endoglucanase